MDIQRSEHIIIKHDEVARKRKSILYSMENQDEVLKDSSRRDIGIAKFLVDNVVHGIEETVVKKEEQRDYKMKVDFEREKDLYLIQQAEYKQKIEMIALNNLNERLINFLKEEKNNQQDLYNKYFTLNSEVVVKLKKLNENLPQIEGKLKKKKEKLKSINQDNLRIMERINKLEEEKKEKQEGSCLIKSSNVDSLEMIKDYKFEENTGVDNSRVANNKTTTRYNKELREFTTHNQSINITELIEDNDYLKERFERLKTLKEKLKTSKKENAFLANEIAHINTTCFYLTKIFTEGMHELSKELLKIHELQLAKIVQRNSNGNSLYFELVKDRLIGNANGAYNNTDEHIKLPIISNNIQKKYNFPLIEKSTPTTSIYNVIKNMIEENHILNKNFSVKKKKFEWDEFKTFSPYQLYTLMSLNKEIIKRLETKMYPRKFDAITEEIMVTESLNKNNIKE